MLFGWYLILSQLYLNKFVDGNSQESIWCNKIYFQHPSEEKFRYVNILNGVYIKSNQIKNGAPIYIHERGRVYFSYSSVTQRFFFSTDSANESQYIGVYSRSGRGLLDAMKRYQPQSFTVNKQEKALRQVFGSFYLEHVNIAYINTENVEITPQCVEFSKCSTNSPLIFTTRIFGKNNVLLNDPEKHYFTPLQNTFLNYRRVYKHSNFDVSGWYLYYKNKRWMVGLDYSSYNAVFYTYSQVQQPEFIPKTVWYRWEKHTNIGNGQIQCKGFKNQICSKLDCRNNARCNTNSLNQPFCTCLFEYTGSKCQMKALKCHKWTRSIRDITINFEHGSLTTYYKTRLNGISYFEPVLCLRYKNKSLDWYPIISNIPNREFPSPTTEMIFNNADVRFERRRKEAELTISLKVLLVVVPLIIPILHYLSLFTCKKRRERFFPDFCSFTCKKRGEGYMTGFLPLCSLYASLEFYVWIAFIVSYVSLDLREYSPKTFNYIMVVSCVYASLSYLLMLIESLDFSKKHARFFKTICRRNNDAGDDAIVFIDKLKQTKPAITFTMICFHEEQRVQELMDNDGADISYSYSEKVVTWKGEEEFVFHHWKDTSNETPTSVCSASSIIEFNLSEDISFANVQTKNAVERHQHQFKEHNKRRDIEYYLIKTVFIENFKDNIVWHGKNIPFWTNALFFWLATLLSFTWPYRVAFKRLTEHKTFTISKVISLTPIGGTDTSPLQMTTETTPQSLTSTVVSRYTNHAYNADQSQEIHNFDHTAITENSETDYIDPNLPSYEDIASDPPPSYFEAIATSF